MKKIFITLFILQSVLTIVQSGEWWKSATFYQIYPKSFKDSNGDGLGDLQGVIEKLDYIKNLGVQAIWMNPVLASPGIDDGYDISDYRVINKKIGNLKQYKDLVKEAHNRNLKVIVDLVPNHTSDQHVWFNKSIEEKDIFKDYYVWRGDNESIIPNNWLSYNKKSAWEWNPTRKQFYLHQFHREEPDLDFRNINVINEMKDILTFWLKTQKVDGVKLVAVPFLIEEASFKSEPLSKNATAKETDYTYLNHIFTVNQPESYDLIYDWRKHIDRISEVTGKTKVCMAEAYQPTDDIIPFYGTRNGVKPGVHFALNFQLVNDLKPNSTASKIAEIIKEWINKLPKIYTPNWMLGNHNFPRTASRLGPERVDLLNMLAGFLPGIQLTYNGEELGMENGFVPCERRPNASIDCASYRFTSKDFARTPFQWDDSRNGGFTRGKSSWLPVSQNKSRCNVEDQEKDPKSHLNVYRGVQQLRYYLKDLDEINVNVLGKNNGVLEVIRYKTDKDGKKSDIYVLVLNYAKNKETVFLSEDAPFKILLRNGKSLKRCGGVIKGRNIDMEPYEALILKKLSPIM